MVKTYNLPHSSQRIFIICNGETYYNKDEAIQHEKEIYKNKYKRPESKMLFDPTQSSYVTFYKIKDKHDWDYLYHVEWEQRQFGDIYDGPGWYSSYQEEFINEDVYNITKKITNEYIAQLEKFLQELKDLTSDQD